ncbi:Methyl-accepting chemotaxis protein [Lentibacillus sp. JNUCC-1]|uniref:methyl-accepting chemotaxis protein n=1 Tax=Lentibacillus sp. JNUCC-1 TaxID=2654513 RepID=UPI0013230AE6|nr:methyl-accepting chemotaxis protein [Lentibacillus sp. JNUCC-1]MUV39029.1 Methyl-accepting chemotaxis protein [Lentibacillus sp. JNUCC-1]
MKFNSIKSKLILVSIVILTIPLIILGVFSYQKSEQSLNELGKTNLKNSVEMTVEMIDSLNREVENGSLSLENAQEEVKKTILGEMDNDGTRPINPQIDLGDHGYMFILDENGIQMAHPFLEGENSWDTVDPDGIKSTQQLIKKAQSGGGFTYFSWPMPNNEDQIEPKVAFSKEDPNWGWTVVAGTYMMDFNKPAEQIFNVIFIVTGVALLLGSILIWLYANRITKPIKKVTVRMNELADGDLTNEPILLKAKDETGQLAEALNHMQDQLKNMISGVSQASEQLSSQSEELTQSASEVKAGSDQVAATMSELATGAETQATSASDLASGIQRFTKYVEEANENGEQIQSESENVLILTKDGTELMDASKTQMNQIDIIVKDAVDKVKGLDNQTKDISKLVAVIQDVAEQTNLLALNAAIEAARAGEHGKGFAVVADEVRKLAEQVSESVTDITRIVDHIQSESGSVTARLEDGYKEVEEGTKQINATDEKFHGINEAITNMAERINAVTDNLSSIAGGSQQMNSSIEDIAAISEESAAGIEETSASSEQTSASMEEVTASSSELAKLAEELHEMVKQFKI